MSGDLQYYKNLEKLLIAKINGLVEDEQRIRDKFPPNTCAQERLNELLNPILNEISKHNAALQRVQWVIKEAAKTNAQRRSERINELRTGMNRLRGKGGKDGKDGYAGTKGRTPDPNKKCK
jgi:hypothetical protein